MKLISVSNLIYLVSKLFYMVCLVAVIFIILFSILSFLESASDMDIPFVEITTQTDTKEHINIDVPFTGMHVSYQNSYLVVVMWLSFVFYTYFFYTLSRFFKVFTKQEVFTTSSVTILKRFMLLNFIPIGVGIIHIVVMAIRTAIFKMDSEYLLIVLHLFVAALVYLYLDVLRKGKLVQDENDLTI